MDWKRDYTVIDLEMTGLNAKNDKIIEIGAVKVRSGRIKDTYSTLVNPRQRIPEKVQQLTGIRDEDVADAMEEDRAVRELIEFIGDDVIVGQNVGFDYSFLKQWAVNHKMPLELSSYDTLKMARKVLPAEEKKTLEALCIHYGIKRENGHRALDDTLETQELFEILIGEFDRAGIEPMEPKMLVYRAKKQTPATKHQIERLLEFRQEHNISDEVPWETLTRSQASRLYDEYRSKYGNLTTGHK